MNWPMPGLAGAELAAERPYGFLHSGEVINESQNNKMAWQRGLLKYHGMGCEEGRG